MHSAPSLVGVAVWGSGENDVWAVGPNTLAHWNGKVWVTEKPAIAIDADFAGVWGSGSKDVWAFGFEELLHWNGASWSDARSQLPSGTGIIAMG